jgi:hypothetical protein
MPHTLAELLQEAVARDEPGFNDPNGPAPGGVDPLGLRQINFQLMDQVFPGVNNVARHIRPFVVVTWAWRRAAQLALNAGLSPAPTDLLRDFVDRIEVIYAWSQFLLNPSADLPGRDVLAPILQSGTYRFDGADWGKRRDTRRYSTAFSAPINYGPALRALGWLELADDGSGAFKASAAAGPAIDALEARISDHLEHPAFSSFGPVTLVEAEVRTWSEAWRLDDPSDVERAVAAEFLAGPANPRRMAGVALACAASAGAEAPEPHAVRRAMCGPPSNFVPLAEMAETMATWRKVQVRQVFRLALEALFAWSIDRLGVSPRPTAALVQAFMSAPGVPAAASTREWLADVPGNLGPTEHLDAMERALQPRDRSEVPVSVLRALAFCLAEAPAAAESFEAAERLPLSVAARQAEGFLGDPPSVLLRHVFEAWLFGQHTYWSIGRGLADARAQGKTLLRLRVVMDEGGWTLTPGATAPTPLATADRLATILALAGESGLLAAQPS